MFQQTKSESIYEGEARYENNQVKLTYAVPPTPPRNDLKRPQQNVEFQVANLKSQMDDLGTILKKTNKHFTKRLAISLAIVVTLLITLVLFHVFDATKTSESTENQKEKSCFDLKTKQIHENGIYTIKLEDDNQQIEVFCDMETDGGGWTLVASIHENDIQKKCDAEDRWSKYVPINRAATEVKTNWENKLMFGNIQQCTENDYKNSAYFTMKASDVMIWHVPSHTPIAEMRSRARLRYRTNTQFLQSRGGNLNSLFDKHYPLKVKSEVLIQKQRTEKIISALEKRTLAVREILSDWYPYSYATGNSDEITDANLYNSRGNNIYIHTWSRYGNLHYGRRLTFTQPRFVVANKKSQPFIMVAAISNKDEKSSIFYVEVRSSRNRSEFIEILENTVTRDDLSLQYRALQFSNTYDPTVCEFHFVIHSTEKWGSTAPTYYQRVYQNNTATSRRNGFTAGGTPSNFVMGYMLLTRSNGNKVTTAQADDVANLILQTISTLKDLFNEEAIDGLAVPVTFDRGDNSTILESIPPNIRPLVEPGFLQFRAYNESGYPNAFCPGIKISVTVPEFGCIGGLSDDLRDIGTCGDFAGWAGRKTYAITQNKASGLAHSQSDISSAILIFYR